jgi:LmbE family N-acetylglucosaminyl deacetylase
VVEVEDVGITQARRLDQVEHMARDLVAAMLDIDADDVRVTFTFEVSPDIDELLTAAKAAVEAAQLAQRRAGELMRQAARRLVEEHLPLRDVARLVGISFQRVHQLTAEPQDTAKTGTLKAAPKEPAAAQSVKTGERKPRERAGV